MRAHIRVFLFPAIFLALLSACAQVRTLRFDLSTAEAITERARMSAGRCSDWRAYLPDTGNLAWIPVRQIRVNFHIMDSRDGKHNFQPEEARIYFKKMLAAANAELDTNVRNWRSPDNTPTLPKRYRYTLAPQPVPGDDGFYFHRDDRLYTFVSQGQHQNNFSSEVVQKYGVGLDSILNIFILVHPEDSCRSKTYRANGQGIALGSALKMAGIYESKGPPENFRGLMNHEIGHILGLSHAWMEDDCPDTNNHENRCWVWSETGPCRDAATNNMMDYNAYQCALTPCQIGRIHAALAGEDSYLRAFAAPVWCTRNPAMDLVIRDSVHWAGAVDLEGHLTVATGGALRVSCRLSMPEGSRITVEPGARLWLDGAFLHNSCKRPWAGIFVKENKQGEKGRVFISKNVQIEHIQTGKSVRHVRSK